MPRRLFTWCLASVLFIAAFAVPQAETPAAPKPNYDLAAQLDRAESRPSRVRHDGDAALARERRSVLVSVSDARGTEVLPRRSGQEDQGPALRSREDGRNAHVDHARALRRAAPAVHDGQVRQEGHGVRVRRPGAARCRRGQADESRVNTTDAAGRGETGRSGSVRRRRGRSAAAGTAQDVAARQAAAPDRRERGRCTSSTTWRPAASTLLDDDYKAPQRPRWAALSPDGKTIVFARNHNLFMMDADNFAKAQKKADDATIVETQLTKDGEEHYSYARVSASSCSRSRNSSSNNSRNKASSSSRHDADTIRQPTRTRACRRCRSSGRATRSKFALVRRDQRKVKDLWVINALAQPRPTLETYRYAMPGEVEHHRSRRSMSSTSPKPRHDACEGRSLQGSDAPDRDGSASPRFAASGRGGGGQGTPDPDAPPAQWLSDTSDKLYFTRPSRDLHKRRRRVADTGHRRGEGARRRAAEHLHRNQAAAPRQQRPGAALLVRARRLGPLLPLRRQRPAR